MLIGSKKGILICIMFYICYYTFKGLINKGWFFGQFRSDGDEAAQVYFNAEAIGPAKG